MGWLQPGCGVNARGWGSLLSPPNHDSSRAEDNPTALPLAQPRAAGGTARVARAGMWFAGRWRFSSRAVCASSPWHAERRSLGALAGPAASTAGGTRISLPSSPAREIPGCVNGAAAHRLPRRAAEVPRGMFVQDGAGEDPGHSRHSAFPGCRAEGLQERWIKAILPPGSFPGIVLDSRPAPNLASGQMSPGWRCSRCLSLIPGEAPRRTAAGARKCCSYGETATCSKVSIAWGF